MPKAGDGGAQNLLKHLPVHGVLICKPCQFAIQPAALSSHLLRHQIYRNERRKLLERLKTYDLKEPEQVTYPDNNAPAIPELPVYRGWICNVPDCGHACASKKRMALHWSDQHGSREVVARTAWLQTFFRGNKIRYFEVSEPASAPTPVTDSDDEQSEPSVRTPSVNQVMLNSLAAEGSESGRSDDSKSVSSSRGYSTKLTPTQLNMLNLQLMHQWSTCTSLTASRGTEPPEFWTKTITDQALNGTDFLMYGCLSTAAFHLATQQRFSPKFHEYREIGLEYQGYAVSDFRRALMTDEPKERLLAFNRILSMTRCAEHHLDPDSTDSAIRPDLEGRSLPILECIMLIRGATTMWCQAQAELPDSSGLKLPTEVFEGLEGIPYDDAVENIFSTSHERYPHIPAGLFQYLLTIPPKLGGHLQYMRLANLQSFKHAFACLLTSFDRSFGAEIWNKWNGVEGWTRMISEHFLGLIETSHPAALVMLGLWAVLVKRLEMHCWYLQGETRRLYRFIREPLDGDLRELVDDMMTLPV